MLAGDVRQHRVAAAGGRTCVAQLGLGDGDLVQQALVLREVADQAQDGGGCRPDRQGGSYSA